MKLTSYEESVLHFVGMSLSDLKGDISKCDEFKEALDDISSQLLNMAHGEDRFMHKE